MSAPMNASRGPSRMARAPAAERTPRSRIWCATISLRACLRSAMAMSPPDSAAAMDVPARNPRAAAILDEFAARTGLTSAAKPRRYLWTDAFAVYTWLGLERVDLAQRLVQQGHEVLGVSRDPEHPTARGLRIGKPLPERAPDEPFDPELEWERDGQYYHHLTKWMHGLQRTARASGEARGPVPRRAGSPAPGRRAAPRPGARGCRAQRGRRGALDWARFAGGAPARLPRARPRSGPARRGTTRRQAAYRLRAVRNAAR